MPGAWAGLAPGPQTLARGPPPPFPFTSASDLYCKGSCMLVYSHVCAHA